MATSKDVAPMPEDEQAEIEVAEFRNERLLAQFAEMATAIPRQDGDGQERILEALFSAASWDDLNAPWNSSSIDDILGKPLKLTHATREPSTFAGGLGQFLVVHLVDPKTETKYVKATSSISVIGAVAMAYFRGWMPLKVEWCRADRATRRGYYPQHLKVLDSFGDGNQYTPSV